MGASAEVKPNRSFQSRLNRVAAQREPLDAEAPEVSVLPDWRAPFRMPLAIIGAFFVGLFAVVAARTARLDLVGGSFSGENADVSMLMDGGLALVGGVTLCVILRYRSLFCVVGNTLGVVAALLLAHNIVHYTPEIYTMLYSDAWATEVSSASEPGSLYFRGDYIALMPEVVDVADDAAPVEADAEALPKVIRLQ